jgi:LuxR family maltose regulon positive regulatory protein
MMLDFTSQTPHETGTVINYLGTTVPDSSSNCFQTKPEPVKLIADKLVIPSFESQISRQRLIEHLEKTTEQFGATLVCGRAGTGKSALASDFAKHFAGKNAAWYKVESADIEWKVFFSYLAASLNQNKLQPDKLAHFVQQTADASVEEATESLSALIFETSKPFLIVLDDLHCVYDAEWFSAFFNSFLPLFSQEANLLLIARSLPPFPLWRMRSKQKLSIVEEPLLAFTSEEAAELFANHGLCQHSAALAHDRSYGRISKLLQFAELLVKNNT